MAKVLVSHVKNFIFHLLKSGSNTIIGPGWVGFRVRVLLRVRISVGDLSVYLGAAIETMLIKKNTVI